MGVRVSEGEFTLGVRGMQGWIKLHRELLDKPIWTESTPEQKTILITLLMMANHSEKEWEWKGESYKARPGQFVTSIPSIVEKCGKGVTVQNVRTALKRFEKYGFLTDESTNRNRLITIVNWEKYQSQDGEINGRSNRQLTGNQQATNRQLTSNKNDKELKKDIYSVFDHWNEKGIIRHRKLTDDIKKTINARLKDGYSLDEILKAIDNYATVLDSDFHFFSHKWVLKDFLKPRNLDRFLDENKPLDIWRKEGALKERPKPPKNETREEMRLRLLKEAAGNTKLVL